MLNNSFDTQYMYIRLVCKGVHNTPTCTIVTNLDFPAAWKIWTVTGQIFHEFGGGHGNSWKKTILIVQAAGKSQGGSPQQTLFFQAAGKLRGASPQHALGFSGIESIYLLKIFIFCYS